MYRVQGTGFVLQQIQTSTNLQNQLSKATLLLTEAPKSSSVSSIYLHSTVTAGSAHRQLPTFPVSVKLTRVVRNSGQGGVDCTYTVTERLVNSWAGFRYIGYAHHTSSFDKAETLNQNSDFNVRFINLISGFLRCQSLTADTLQTKTIRTVSFCFIIFGYTTLKVTRKES